MNFRGLFVDKVSGSGIFPVPDPDPGDPTRPDSTGSGSATLILFLTKLEYKRKRRTLLILLRLYQSLVNIIQLRKKLERLRLISKKFGHLF